MDVSQKVLSEVIVFSKYAKFIPEIGRRETWEEICDRNMSMHITKYPQLRKEIQDVYHKFVYTKKVLPSMRSMQFGGRPIELNNTRIFNCAYAPVDHPVIFAEVMQLLLGGTGVGFSVQTHHIEKLPVIQGPATKRRRFLVGDSIEGWADAVKVLFKAYTCGKSDPEFDYRDIRAKGSQLITAGGKAPGPDPLRICIDQIRKILNVAIGRKLQSIECHDIMCHIADAVLSGGIRRAAMISFFSLDDVDMLSCKTGPWWELNPQRGRANNSVVLERDKITKDQFLSLWRRIESSGAGEPGVYFTNNREVLSNPCVSGDALITVSDHGVNGGAGLPYKIPMKLLYEMSMGTDLLPCALSYNEATKEYEWKQIERAMLTKHNAKMVRITDESGKSVKVTPDHKIYTQNRGWVEAQNLLVADLLLTESEGITSTAALEYLDETETVYDITVADNHNFFADGICVHNCVEATLNAHQFCNLTELNVDDVESQEDYNNRAKAAAFIGTLQAGYTNFHYLRSIWREVTEKEALIGVGMTGIASGKVLGLNMSEAAKVVVEENKRVAAIIGINQAARTTLVKPSGTSSLTVGSASGIHGWHNDYYIRRVRVGKNEPLHQYLKENFPDLIEDCQFKPHLESVMSFPQKAPEGAIMRTETAIQLLRRVRKVSQEWILPGHVEGEQRHNVSCTISIKPREWEPVGEWMWNNRNEYNGVAVLPYDGGTYVQAPFQNCTKEEFDEMAAKLHDIDLTQVIEQADLTAHTMEAACAGGQCSLD